jgi:NAD(P)H dehydrogenase (quinone)
VKVFLVLAHPESASFNGEMHRVAQKALLEAGHEVRVSDLHAMNFNPVPGFHDVKSPVGKDVFNIQVEQENAAQTGTFADDIAGEQDKLYWCDLVIFQFPLWWFGIPAMLKGWYDRVFAYGWAYHRRERFDSGRLQGRRAVLSITTGGPKERFATGTMYAPLDQLLFPVTVGTLQYVGLQMMKANVAWSVPRVDDAQRQVFLDDYRERLLKIEHEAPLPFHSLHDFPDPAGETLFEPQGVLEALMEEQQRKSA